MTDLTPLQRPSGGFAMLAVDQREALRLMFAEHQDEPVTDAQLRDFKLEATRILSPDASAVLLDPQFALGAAIERGVVAPGCGLIAAADHFEPAYGETVGRVSIDRQMDPVALRRSGVVALKLLVIHRPDGGARERIAMVEEFVDICRGAGLVSIIEPVARKPHDGGAWDWDAGVLNAARELGRLGADLYKAEVPGRGETGEAAVRAGCRMLTEAIDGPWVVLSSGVGESRFPEAVRWACEEGASGFLAGRAVWASCLGKPDLRAELEQHAARRLRRLADLVDAVIEASKASW